MRNMGPTTILNGFGISLGDGIIGLQALRAAQEIGAVGPVVLGRIDPSAKPLVAQLYALAQDFAAVVPMAEAPISGPVIDIRDFALDPGFARISMIDFFLSRLGVPPDSVPSAQKRNSWLAPRARPLSAPGATSAYALVCPDASIALRDMPEEIHAAILTALADRGVPTVSQRTTSPSGSLLELCALVASARWVITTDTAMVHLADAFSVPCLAFFTTHRPEWRARDYPFCRSAYLPTKGLPESIEFIRTQTDLVAARAAWFPEGQDLSWLTQALNGFLG